MHKIFFYNMFIIRLYLFRALCAHHQEVKIVLHCSWCHHNSRWPSRAQVEKGLARMQQIKILKIVLPFFISQSILSPNESKINK